MTCKICRAPVRKRAQVERLILKRVPVRDIARQTGFSRDGITRHKRHIKTAIAVAHEKQAITTGKIVFDQFIEMWDDAVAQYRRARKASSKVLWFREKRALFEMAAKLGLQAQQEKYTYKGCHPSIIRVIRRYLPETREHYEA